MRTAVVSEEHETAGSDECIVSSRSQQLLLVSPESNLSEGLVERCLAGGVVLLSNSNRMTELVAAGHSPQQQGSRCRAA